MQRSFEGAEQGCKCKGLSKVRSKVSNAKVYRRCGARLQMQRSIKGAEQGCKCKGLSKVRSKVANAKVLRKVLRKDTSLSDLLKDLR